MTAVSTEENNHLCCICEKEKADTGYDMMFCKDCWDEKW